MVTLTNFRVYVCASEVCVVFTLLLFFPTPTIDLISEDIVRCTGNYIAWAHAQTTRVPDCAEDVTSERLCLRMHFWKELDKHVHDSGPMCPVSLFCHGLQAAYSRTKGGLDCAAQSTSELNCSGMSPGFKQKVTIFFMKTLLVNSFTVRRLMENE